jgi:very-short-patch-repair endonuclease
MTGKPRHVASLPRQVLAASQKARPPKPAARADRTQVQQGRIGSDLERAFETQLRALGAPEWVSEYRFASPRRYRFDFAFPAHMLAIELDGGTWINGGHSRGAGFARNCEKLNLAVRLGWRVLRYDTDMVNDWRAAREVVETLGELG